MYPETVKHKILLGISTLFIISFIILAYSTFNINSYDIFGNQITNPTIETLYSENDGIGIPIFLKNNIFYSSPNITIVSFFLLFTGIFLLIIKTKTLNEYGINPVLKKIFFFALLFITLSVCSLMLYLFGYKDLLRYPYYFLISIVFLVIILFYKKFYLLFKSDKIMFFFMLIISLYLGLGIIFELINYIGCAYIHEGNWALVDENGISLYNKYLQYNFNVGDITFRISNLSLWIFALIFTISFEYKDNGNKTEH